MNAILNYILLANMITVFVQSDDTNKPKPCIADSSCKCVVSNEIDVYCEEDITDLSLRSSFDNYFKGETRSLVTFWLLNNNNITAVRNYALANVSFVNINIRNVKTLTTIEENAFISSITTAKAFRLTSTSVNSSYSLFKAISKLINLSELTLDDNEIEVIPDFAFGEQTKLQIVYLTRNKIRHLGEFAFFSLTSMTILDISNNRLEELENNTFSIKPFKDSFGPQKVNINVRLNQLVRISESVFSGLDRPVEIDISFNNLTTLNPGQFASILKYDTTKIIVKGNKINCDCGLKWIYDKQEYKQRISGPLRCADKRYFQEMTDIDFKNCTSL